MNGGDSKGLLWLLAGVGIYLLLSDDGDERQKRRDTTLLTADPFELEQGIEVEMEHTDDPHVAEQIALDHLDELPDYYTRLVAMERDAGI